MARFLTYTIAFAILLFLQEYVFSAINIWGVVNIFAYVMIILILPLSVHRVWLMLLAFLIGYLMDTVMGSYGLNAICLVWLAFVRNVVGELTLGRDVVLAGLVPSAYRVGAQRFMSYLILMCLLFAIPYFLLEVMSFSGILITILRIVLSSVLTAMLIFVFNLPFNK
ncbi:MAG: hypothetical protein RR465_00555 [Mucinivorans sp.]